MPSKAPLLLLTAVALAATLVYLLQSPKRDDDDHENDLQLHDDVSDDATVQVKNGGASEVSTEVTDRGIVGEASEAETSAKSADAPVQTIDEKPQDEPVKVSDGPTKQGGDKEVSKSAEAVKSDVQQEDNIRREALSKAATIISSMPEVSLVDECIQEVAAAESKAATEIIVDTTKDLTASNITTITEDAAESIKFEPTEQSVPIKSVPSTPNRKMPKTPPVSLFSPSPAKDEVEAPIDTEDYSKLKDYWKHQDDKHTFSPPRGIDTEVASPVRPPVVESDTEARGMVRSSSKEDNAAASAAVAGLMAAGVVNMLDQVYSPKGGQGQSFEDTKDEEDVPMMDVSMVDEKAKSEDKQEEGSDEQLILGSSSPSSGSDKSSSDDYVKIVRTPSGDPITESALLSRPLESATISDEKDNVEEINTSVLEESAAVVSVEDAKPDAKSEGNTTKEGATKDTASSEATPEDRKTQTKSKAKKKKKKGKKK